jgi:hypothetical protein
VTNADIEMSYIREFATGGVLLGSNLSSEDRRERIRTAILMSGKAHRPFFDSGLTYGQAYQRLYGRPLDMRKRPRDADGPPVGDVIAELGDEDE